MVERLDRITCSFSDLAERRVIEAAETVDILERLQPKDMRDPIMGEAL